MFIKSLDELLERENLVGFQDGHDLKVAKEITKCLGPEKAQRRWNKGITMVNPQEFEEWGKLVEEGSPIYILVTNLAKSVGDLTVEAIRPAVFPDGNHHSQPMIVFNVY